MRVIIAAVVITTLITMPAVAQYGPSSGYSKPPSALKAKSKKTEATRSYAREYRVSPYSFNPAHDVYVNGNYVGSDPDPRVRATLKNEERSQGGMR
jgi:hypothetical protein